MEHSHAIARIYSRHIRDHQVECDKLERDKQGDIILTRNGLPTAWLNDETDAIYFEWIARPTRAFFGVELDDMGHMMDNAQWVDDNLRGRYMISGRKFYFELEEDAIALQTKLGT